MKIEKEVKVGMLLFFSFSVLIGTLMYISKANLITQGYRLHIIFRFLNGLKKGASVRLGGGIKIGVVENISQIEDKADVLVYIDKKYPLREGTQFTIYTFGLMGEKYINVYVPPYIENNPYLQDGDIIIGIDPASFDQMMLEFNSFLQNEGGGEILARIFKNSEKFINQLNKLISDNKGDIKQAILALKYMAQNLNYQSYLLLKHLNQVTKDAAYLSSNTKESIKETMKNLEKTTKDLADILSAIKNQKGTAGKLIYNDEIYQNLLSASRDAAILFKKLKEKPYLLLYKE